MRSHEHVSVFDVNKEILKNTEGFNKDDWPLTREWLANIYTWYGYKLYWQTGVLEQTKKRVQESIEAEKESRMETKAEPKEAIEEAKVEPIPLLLK